MNHKCIVCISYPKTDLLSHTLSTGILFGSFWTLTAASGSVEDLWWFTVCWGTASTATKWERDGAWDWVRVWNWNCCSFFHVSIFLIELTFVVSGIILQLICSVTLLYLIYRWSDGRRKMGERNPVAETGACPFRTRLGLDALQTISDGTATPWRRRQSGQGEGG